VTLHYCQYILYTYMTAFTITFVRLAVQLRNCSCCCYCTVILLLLLMLLLSVRLKVLTSVHSLIYSDTLSVLFAHLAHIERYRSYCIRFEAAVCSYHQQNKPSVYCCFHLCTDTLLLILCIVRMHAHTAMQYAGTEHHQNSRDVPRQHQARRT
jgi:hypothetical protein